MRELVLAVSTLLIVVPAVYSLRATPESVISGNSEDIKILRRRHLRPFMAILFFELLALILSLILGVYILSTFDTSPALIVAFVFTSMAFVPQFAINTLRQRRGDEWYRDFVGFLNRTYGIDIIRIWTPLVRIAVVLSLIALVYGVIDSLR